MSVKAETLQRRRAKLNHQMSALRVVADRQLDALVETRLKMRNIDIELALLDRNINSIIDTTLERMVATHGKGNGDEG